MTISRFRGGGLTITSLSVMLAVVTQASIGEPESSAEGSSDGIWSSSNPETEILGILEEVGISLDTDEARRLIAEDSKDPTETIFTIPRDESLVSKPEAGERLIYAIETTIPRTPEDFARVDAGISSFGLKLADVSSTQTAALPGNSFAFGDNDSTTNIVTEHSEGFQILVIAESADAPETFVFEMELGGGHAELDESGAVFLYSKDGLFNGIIDTPWALDAAGNPIETSFFVEGEKLTQIVKHSSNPGTQYPVVEDPYYSSGPFSRTTVSAFSPSNPGYKVSAWLSNSGRVFHSRSPQTFSAQGWNVLMANHDRYLINRPSMFQQWECHVVGGIFERDSWDLETGRTDNPRWRWRIGTVWPASAVCNW